MKLLVCGTRDKKMNYKKLVYSVLDLIVKPELILHGACQKSADEYAQEWAKKNNVKTKPFPGFKGTYLKRNIEMVKELQSGDSVLAFWDGWSYGTAHTVATAVLFGIEVRIVGIR